jgi:hypothetical protein
MVVMMLMKMEKKVKSADYCLVLALPQLMVNKAGSGKEYGSLPV